MFISQQKTICMCFCKLWRDVTYIGEQCHTRFTQNNGILYHSWTITISHSINLDPSLQTIRRFSLYWQKSVHLFVIISKNVLFSLALCRKKGMPMFINNTVIAYIVHVLFAIQQWNFLSKFFLITESLIFFK